MKRNDTLLAILNDLRGQSFTVTDTRDNYLHKDPDPGLDKAQLRRWINGRFTTLVRQGVLKRTISTQSGKHVFELVTKANTQHAGTRTPAARAPNKSQNNQVPSSSEVDTLESLKSLNQQLHEHNLLADTLLSQVKECRRVADTIPSLKNVSEQQLEQATKEHCVVLGKIKALEGILRASRAAL